MEIENALVIGRNGGSLLLSQGSKRFRAWPALPLTIDQIGIGDRVGIRWDRNTAYAHVRLGRSNTQTIDGFPNTTQVTNITASAVADIALTRDGSRSLYSYAKWLWEPGAEMADLLRATTDGIELIGLLYNESSDGHYGGIMHERPSMVDPVVFFAGANGLSGDEILAASFVVTESGHMIASDVDITAGNGVRINTDGIRVGGAGASALVINEVKEIVGGVPVGMGIHGIRFYDIVGVPAISLLTQKSGTNSPLFRLGRDTDADWLQWDSSGLALSGTVTAKAGALGGWTIALNDLHAGSGASRVGLAPGTMPFYAGAEDPALATFRVTPAGGLTALNAVITGTINATGGVFSGALQVGTGDPNIVIDGASALQKSSNYSPGIAGWQVTAAGDAEFNNVIVRGLIASAVYQKSLVTAFAGSQIVAKSAGVLYEGLILDQTVTIKVHKSAGAGPFAETDLLFIRTELIDVWLQVQVDLGDQGDYWAYTVLLLEGSGLLQPGEAIVDYGNAGDGFWGVSADGLFGAGAAFVLASHGGMPWDTENLSGFGVTRHVYSGPDGRLYAGNGNVRLDTTGVRIRYGNAETNEISWYDENDVRIGAIACMSGLLGEPVLALAGPTIEFQARTMFFGGIDVVMPDAYGYAFRSQAGAHHVGNSAATIGFYGANPIARQVLATGAGKTVDNVISALQALGLVSQS